jgi:hypothetical protein
MHNFKNKRLSIQQIWQNSSLPNIFMFSLTAKFKQIQRISVSHNTAKRYMGNKMRKVRENFEIVLKN